MSNKSPADLQGAGRLTIDAIKGITSIVESLHQSIASFIGLPTDRENSRTKAVSGVVYRNINNITGLVGSGVDVLLGRLDLLVGSQVLSPNREALVSALNGVLGDHLHSRGNPLAIKMQFRSKGKALTEKELLQKIVSSKGRLLILVHGSCMSDLQWRRAGHNHGDKLTQELGLEAVYLHYNSGMRVAENGKQFAELIEITCKDIYELKELYIVSHSMGGLVTRSACYYAEQENYTWLKKLKKLLFLGTPHQGAILEKFGNWFDNALLANQFSAPFAKLSKIRSNGINDLRHGNIIDDNSQAGASVEESEGQRIPPPLPQGVECYAIAVITTPKAGSLGAGFVGDGLVSLNSALGIHKDQKYNLGFKQSKQWVGRGINHMGLLNDREVYAVLKQYIQE